jgi:acyl carrier protein
MEDASGARQIVFDVIDQMNHEFPEQEGLNKSPSTVLFGPGGGLDSLGLVDLVMRIQEAILDEYDVAVAVANEQVLSSEASPLRTVESLIQHVEGLLANV